MTINDPMAEVQDAMAPGASYADLLERGSDEPLEWTVEDELAPITINYTSGTTGKPKGVVYTHRGAYLTASGRSCTPSTAPDRSICGRSPCFIATAGARLGR